MINAINFAREILVESPDSSLTYALQRERESLWPIWGEIEELSLAAGESMLQLSPNSVGVILASWNRKLLTRAKENFLDATKPNWRVAPNGVPRNYIFKGEQGLQQLRIYPPPAESGRVQIIKHVILPEGQARWHDILLSMAIINRLSAIDPLRARMKEVNYFHEIILMIFKSQGVFNAE